MVNRKKRRVLADCIYGDSENDADQRYLAGFFVPDRFLSLKMGRKSIGVFGDLEINRAQKESRLTEVLSSPAVNRAAGEWLNKKNTDVADQIAWLANVYSIDAFRLPENFPAWLSEGMRKHGLKFQIVRGALFASRHV
ncbi:MAG: hypothetical protein O7C75_06935, partial [Verrucomicrobia bacterium]|nr:hypothetical protein [Verrucomicrobiota bacterium]